MKVELKFQVQGFQPTKISKVETKAGTFFLGGEAITSFCVWQSGCVCFRPHCTFCSCQVIHLKATGLIALDLAGYESNESLAPIEMQPMKPKIATENNLPKISKGQNLIETLTRFYLDCLPFCCSGLCPGSIHAIPLIHQILAFWHHDGGKAAATVLDVDAIYGDRRKNSTGAVVTAATATGTALPIPYLTRPYIK